MGIYLKYHKHASIIALCDEELIGKKFEDEIRHLDLDKHGDFYLGKIMKESEICSHLKDFSSINAVGKRSVNEIIKAGLAKKESVVSIGGTPHLQVYMIRKN